MEDYKQYLVSLIGVNSVSEIYDKIKDDPRYMYNITDGQLHSLYIDDHYEPAVMYKHHKTTQCFWLFNGEIADCLHPFEITFVDDVISHIGYYSSQRMSEGLPIFIEYTKTLVMECINIDRAGRIILPNTVSMCRIHKTPYSSIPFTKDRYCPLFDEMKL